MITTNIYGIEYERVEVSVPTKLVKDVVHLWTF
jgi:hypothetical protein